ncbi:clavesin-2-like isoform X3 [Stylophora pistillata]|uniref:Clavesin-2 n=1 Tax=Stylophora pistillata TaxID=50429 RepID=A0A2B4SHW4_STYPI|nr:clavesin-2-like isoform X3 [Stylophora pistillata]PFX28168.1 Clavesin-2 [Stylophora pistillata]
MLALGMENSERLETDHEKTEFVQRRGSMEASESCDHKEDVENQHSEKIKELRSKIDVNMDNNVLRQVGRVDDAFLLMFLRARRYIVDESFKLLSNYIEFRQNNASLMENLSAWELHHVLEDGLPCVLPYTDQNGAKIIVIFAGSWDKDTYGTLEILKAFILTMERLIKTDEAQLNGIKIIADFSGWTASHTSSLSLSFIRQVFAMFQIHLHGNNMATLHDHCHLDTLPAEFGGKMPAVNRAYWARVLVHLEGTKRSHVYGENPFRRSLSWDTDEQKIPHVIIQS